MTNACARMPQIKEVVNWHKEIKVEEQLEKVSRKFHPYQPNGWREKRKRELRKPQFREITEA